MVHNITQGSPEGWNQQDGEDLEREKEREREIRRQVDKDRDYGELAHDYGS